MSLSSSTILPVGLPNAEACVRNLQDGLLLQPQNGRMDIFPRRILDLLGIEVPIIQAPMLGVTTPAMVVGVAEAGGLGSIPLSNLSTREAQCVFSRIRRNTSKPININFLC